LFIGMPRIFEGLQAAKHAEADILTDERAEISVRIWTARSRGDACDIVGLCCVLCCLPVQTQL
jgi:hypothetical protein